MKGFIDRIKIYGKAILCSLGTVAGVKVYICHSFVSFRSLLGPDAHYFLLEMLFRCQVASSFLSAEKQSRRKSKAKP